MNHRDQPGSDDVEDALVNLHADVSPTWAHQGSPPESAVPATDDLGRMNDEAVHLARQQRFEEAIAIWEQIMAGSAFPGHVVRNLARAYAESGTLPETDSRTLLAQLEAGAEGESLLGMLGRVQRIARKYSAAIRSFQLGIEIAPKMASLHYDLALTYSDAGQPDLAVESYRQAVAIAPDFADAWNNLGVLHQERGSLEESIRCHREVIRLNPQSAAGHNNLGVAYNDLRNYEEAVACYQKAVEIDPQYAFGWSNMGNSLRHLGRLEDAVQALSHAISIKPDYAEAFNNIAITYLNMGNPREALHHYNQALLLRPHYPEARMNRGLCWLTMGDLEQGFVDYEWRWKLRGHCGRQLPGLKWDGGPLVGKRIFIFYEQGLGDTFQFIRYAAELKARGATVIFECQPNLQAILANSPGIDEVIPRGQPIPDVDFHASLMSLPGLFKTRLESVPVSIPYIHTRHDLIRQWGQRLGSIEGFKIGIAWQGNPDHRGDRQRSIPLERFESLARLPGGPGVKLVSLQHGVGTEQLDRVRDRFEVIDLQGVGQEVDGFLRTAAILHQLDLIISVDSAVVHLACAMGLPTWVAMPYSADWRWLRDREDSPWYPTIRIFRQERAGDWDGVFSRIEHALRQRLEHGPRTRVISDADIARAKELVKQATKLTGSPAQSEAMLKSAISIDPNSRDAHHDLGVVYARSGQLVLAIAQFRRALELKPDSAQTNANIGLAFLHHDQLDEAVAHLRTAIRLGGGTPEVHNNLGVALSRQPNPAVAVTAYHEALLLRPDYPEAHYNLAQALLIQGAFREGWVELEWRWHCFHGSQRNFHAGRWTGTDQNDKTILLHAEHSDADAIQFIRYVSLVKRRCARVIVECSPELAPLFSHMSEIDQVVPRGEPLPHYDAHVALMSLPAVFGTTLHDVPAHVPYLTVDQAWSAKYGEYLRNLNGFKVGVCGASENDRERFIPLNMFQPLTNHSGIRLIHLQQDHTDGELRLFDVREVVEPNDRWRQTAAIIQHLDLVVTADTTVAHLAGALGKPVWIAVPHAPDWRWLLGQDTSPWYPTMRLYRQTERGNWGPVIDRIVRDISGVVGAGPKKARN